MTSIDAARVLTDDGWLGPSRLEVSDGRISAIVPLSDADARAVDGVSLCPGFVDLQVNGLDDIDVAAADGRDWERLDALLLAQGVTTWCPTLVSMPLESYARPLGRISAAMQRSTTFVRPAIAGVHLEGPFLGAAPGAHRPENVRAVDQDWLDSLPSTVRLMTIAPEQDGAIEAVRTLVERGVVVSVGHTRCSETAFDDVVASGATLVTHLFNGMSGIHHREPGVATFALTSPSVHCSLIADGVHVHPRVLRLAFAQLGPRAILVTDAVAWRSGRVADIGIDLRDGAPRLADGTLAGSAITMDGAVRVCIEAGIAPETALRAASTRPADVLGLDDRGRIAVGQRADLVGLDDGWQVVSTWVGGRRS